jgi:gluconokinase
MATGCPSHFEGKQGFSNESRGSDNEGNRACNEEIVPAMKAVFPAPQALPAVERLARCGGVWRMRGNPIMSANDIETTNRVVVVMGVSGCGKSSVARALAAEFDAAMLDGDFLHPRANVEKMARGEPLTDDDRRPWLAALNDAAFAMSRTNKLSILVCSALKRSYRDRLREGNPGLCFIYLKGSYELIETRIMARTGHFLKPGMLKSQFEALEEPGGDEADVMTVGVEGSLAEVVAAARHVLEQATA